MNAQGTKGILLAWIDATEPRLSHMAAVIEDWIVAAATPGHGLATNDENPDAVAAQRCLLLPNELREDAAQTVEQDVLVNRLVAEIIPLLPILQRSGEFPVGDVAITFR